MLGRYHPFFKFLDTRYADRVVLTFGEIEDLLGFTLPNAARVSEEWWTNPDPDATRPCLSDTWMLANRSARPNLKASNVVFDRRAEVRAEGSTPP